MQYTAQKFPNIHERSLRSHLYFCKKKCHAERKSKNFTALANIIVAQLNGPFISSEVPLQTSGVLRCSRTFFYDGILKLLVFLAQLFRLHRSDHPNGKISMRFLRPGIPESHPIQ